MKKKFLKFTGGFTIVATVSLFAANYVQAQSTDDDDFSSEVNVFLRFDPVSPDNRNACTFSGTGPVCYIDEK